LGIGLLADIAAHESAADRVGNSLAPFDLNITTLPPAAASMRALPSPSPEAPPVTMNTLPAMSMSVVLSVLRH
jgi:hypothetical protein